MNLFPSLTHVAMVLVGTCLTMALTTASPLRAEDSRGEGPSPLPAEVARLARELEHRPPAGDGVEADMPPATGSGDPDLPANALREAMEELRRLSAAEDAPAARALQRATEDLEAAWRHYAGGSEDLDHLSRTLHALHDAQLHLRRAGRLSGDSRGRASARLQHDLSEIGARIAGDLIGLARDAGVPARRLRAAQRRHDQGLRAAGRGNHGSAAAHQAAATELAADTIVFDVALFRNFVLDTLQGETVGHAFSIAYQGVSYNGGDAVGLARTSSDEPETDQSPNKESHVASVSKPITAIALLRLLDEQGVSPYEPVHPYLPSNWKLGAGVELLTFADFLKHESGFAQNDVGNSYANLRIGIDTDVGVKTFSYSNANYGLMRVLIPGLLGIDPVDYPEFSSPSLMASAFILHVQALYESIDVEIGCASSDPEPTIQYKFPYPNDSGYLEPDRWEICGDVGWFIDSNEIAAVMAHLRNSQALLPAAVRGTMQQDFLGFMDPANYLPPLSNAINGSLGLNFMHGGDWGAQRRRAPRLRGGLPDPAGGGSDHQLQDRRGPLPMRAAQPGLRGGVGGGLIDGEPACALELVLGACLDEGVVCRPVVRDATARLDDRALAHLDAPLWTRRSMYRG